MSKRKHELLTYAEREKLIGIPRDRDQLARLYTFELADLELIGIRRQKQNWLGAALQLALMRHPGMSLAQFLQDQHEIPGELLAFVAAQLDLSPRVLADYAARDQTMTGHARELATRLGMRGPARSDIPLMIHAAAQAAWATDKGIVIATGVITVARGRHFTAIDVDDRADRHRRPGAGSQAGGAGSGVWTNPGTAAHARWPVRLSR